MKFTRFSHILHDSMRTVRWEEEKGKPYFRLLSIQQIFE